VGSTEEAAALADSKWALLQAEVEANSLAPDATRRRAAELLAQSALGRLRPYTVLAERWDEPVQVEVPAGGLLFGGPMLPKGLLDALGASLGEDSHYVTDFLAENAQMTAVHEAFWQGELYLESLHAAPGESSPQETLREAETQAATHAPELSGALEDSVLVARQNFVVTARFGYFVRRCRQRLALERRLGGEGESGGRSLEEFLRGVSPEDTVEMTRLATREAASAVEVRADQLFGDYRELLGSLARGPQGIEQIELSVGQAQRLTVEAAAFGASLFEAEEAASRRYEFSFTSFGSRNEGPLGPRS